YYIIKSYLIKKGSMNSVGPVIWEAPIVENPNCIPMGTIQEFFVRLKDRILVKCIFLLEKQICTEDFTLTN
ncbi:MAG: hypothetical protein KGQ54_00070, partial [Verrucomicrobia bacterium]|nr:hypothetical protein [Verrucomicrobiota bacterium]